MKSLIRFTTLALCAGIVLALPGAHGQSFGGYPNPGQIQIGQPNGNPASWLSTIGPLTINPSGIISLSLAASPYLTGTLPMTSGGCGASLLPTAGALLYTNAFGCQLLPASPFAGSILQQGLQSAPTWSSTIFASSFPASSILYANGPNNVKGLTPCASGVLVYSPGSLPSCGTILPASLTVPTPTLSGLSVGSCSNGVAINASNQAILVACPGGAGSIDAGGATSITNGKANDFLFQNGANVGHTGLPYAALASAAGAI